MKAEFAFQMNDEAKTIAFEPRDEEISVTIDGRAYRVSEPTSKLGTLHFSVDGRRFQAVVVKKDEKWTVNIGGQQWVFTRPAAARSRWAGQEGADGTASGLLTATMPGQVLEVLIAVGETVERGQALVLLEAMKMELRITAPFAGVVQEVHCVQGQTVERDQPLVEILVSS